MILGSAPEYPHGIVDPIEGLSEVALKKKVPLHVDACVGGYLLPFVEKLGHEVPPWDFRVPGVTSISADIHKYGYAAKGASAILYRSADTLEHQMFVHTDWPGGIFASAGMLGTRPGGAVAAAWATMQALGHDGYMEQSRKVMDATQRIIEGVRAIPELEIIGRPHMSLLSYRSVSGDLNIFAVGDQMEQRGWHIDRLQKPDALHAMVTPLHAEVVDEYLEDLRTAVETVRGDPELATKGGAAMYGMISHVPLRGMIRKTVLKMMMDMYGPDVKIPDGEGMDLGDDLAGRIAGRVGEAYLRLVEKVRGLR
jgi:glutamate/tyrosine decarboxylase-like PLP-dependent enzyme